MGRIRTKSKHQPTLEESLIKSLEDAVAYEQGELELKTETVIERIVEVPVEIIKEVIVEKIVQVPAVCKCEPKVTVIEKIVEVPKIETEYVTITEIETVELPVEKIVEKVVKVHDIEQVIAEKRRTESALKKVKILSVVCAALAVLTIIMAVL